MSKGDLPQSLTFKLTASTEPNVGLARHHVSSLPSAHDLDGARANGSADVGSTPRNLSPPLLTPNVP